MRRKHSALWWLLTENPWFYHDLTAVMLVSQNDAQAGARQMEPLSPLISWVNPFPSRFINRTIFFCNALESHEWACCLLFDLRQSYSHFSIFIGSQFPPLMRFPPQETVLFIDLLGKGSTPRAYMEDRGSICRALVPRKFPRWCLPRFQSESSCTTFNLMGASFTILWR